MGVQIGSILTKNRVFLAPMSGVTDEAFRLVAHEHGAGLVVSEMVASEELVRERPDMVRRTRGGKRLSPFVIQLAGREAHWMAEGARVAQDMGADIIDINMGCPARQVTGGLSGSALMRDPDHALTLIEATVGATQVPVTVKMRLGWDAQQMNAPDLAKRAENAGAQMITVHGRTRCQFYTGKADWQAIRAVRDAISIPLVANGDGVSPEDAQTMMQVSGADAVMLGRGTYGRPWWAGAVAEALLPGSGKPPPSLEQERDMVLWHQQETLSLYGNELGNKTFRKHLGWLFDRLLERHLLSVEQLRALRSNLLSSKDNAAITTSIKSVFSPLLNQISMGSI
jgi:tRNA-dihydrouridine synthase B